MLFLDNTSALQLFVPAMCSVTMCISSVAAKNHKDLRRCITVLSLEETLVMADYHTLLSRCIFQPSIACMLLPVSTPFLISSLLHGYSRS